MAPEPNPRAESLPPHGDGAESHPPPSKATPDTPDSPAELLPGSHAPETQRPRPLLRLCLLLAGLLGLVKHSGAPIAPSDRPSTLPAPEPPHLRNLLGVALILAGLLGLVMGSSFVVKLALSEGPFCPDLTVEWYSLTSTTHQHSGLENPATTVSAYILGCVSGLGLGTLLLLKRFELRTLLLVVALAGLAAALPQLLWRRPPHLKARIRIVLEQQLDARRCQTIAAALQPERALASLPPGLQRDLQIAGSDQPSRVPQRLLPIRRVDLSVDPFHMARSHALVLELSASLHPAARATLLEFYAETYCRLTLEAARAQGVPISAQAASTRAAGSERKALFDLGGSWNRWRQDTKRP